jgi:hypothetical protein
MKTESCRRTAAAVLACFVVFHHPDPSAEAPLKNSAYSMAGIGRPSDCGFGIARAMGGVGIAFPSGRSLNTTNPASITGIPRNVLLLELGASGINERSQKGSAVQTASDINFDYFAAGLYLRKGWALTFGLMPFSSTDYEIRTPEGIAGEQTLLEKKIRGTGGWNRVFLGQSFGGAPGIAAGFDLSCVFGPMTRTETVDSSGSFSGYMIRDERTAQAFDADFGVQLSARTGKWLHAIGATAGARRTVRTRGGITMTTGGETAALERDDDPVLGIPARLGIGVSTRKEDRFGAGFDVVWKQWSEFDWKSARFGIRDSRRCAAGAEVSAAGIGGLPDGVIFRAGAFTERTALTVKNTPIDARGIDFGVAIPFNPVDVLNLSVEYGAEGTLEKGLIRSTYWMLSMSLSMHQFIGVRPPSR